MVSCTIAKWTLVRKEFINISRYPHILSNWDACMARVCIKVKGGWLSKQTYGCVKFNVESAAKGMPGITGVRGALHNDRGDFVKVF